MHFFSAFRLRRLGFLVVLGFLVGFGGNQDRESERDFHSEREKTIELRKLRTWISPIHFDVFGPN